MKAFPFAASKHPSGGPFGGNNPPGAQEMVRFPHAAEAVHGFQ